MNFLSNKKIRNLCDLPNEILLIILNKMNKIDVLYLLLNLNERFNQLILDPLYIGELDLTRKSWLDKISPMNKQTLDKFCEEILPEINNKVCKLIVESVSMERILNCGEYCQLDSLSLLNFQQEPIIKYLTEETIVRSLLINQIKCLRIDIEDIIKIDLLVKRELNIFSLILSLCKHLTDLTFNQWFTDRKLTISISDLPSTSCRSLSLTKLNIFVNTFDDCLYLLDGRLPCLSTLIIKILKIFAVLSNIDNSKNLAKLKSFSLTSRLDTSFYDSQVVPLLHRMSNLEELTLYLSVVRTESTYIDGIDLYDQILINMTQLKTFTFSILTRLITLTDNCSSNEDIQRSFIGKLNQQIGCYVNINRRMEIAECHVYSIPYQFDSFPRLTNVFPRGKFNKVEWLIMSDLRPFEHHLFQIISHDFPFLQSLILLNPTRQQNKQHTSTLITFPNLIELDFHYVHTDYVEQFLFRKNADLPRLLSLEIGYQPLAVVTNNFTNDESHLICAQLKRLIIKDPFVPPQHFHSYFPLVEIESL